jgi:hypothetical protein
MTLFAKLAEVVGIRAELPPPAEPHEEARSKAPRIAELQRALSKAHRAGDVEGYRRLSRELEATL